MRSAKPIRWPNGLGWDVEVEHGTAEVRDQVSHLRAFVPVAPRREWSDSARKWIEVAQHRVCDFPVGTSPEDAVGECARAGLLRDDGDWIGAAVPFVRLLALRAEP